MIGKLKGVVDSYGEDFVILDVQGVGYVVHCSARTLQRMPGAGEAASLAIETHVREDMIRLYGFRSDAEREWFRLLQTVQGVGSKVALGLLSVLEPEALATAIAMGDKTAIAPRARGRATPRRPAHRRIEGQAPPSRRSTPPSWPLRSGGGSNRASARRRCHLGPWSISVTPRSRPPPPSPPR